MGKMSEVLKNVKTASPERLRLQGAIDDGKDVISDEAKRYFFNRPPYQYTALEPKSWGTRKTKGDNL